MAEASSELASAFNFLRLLRERYICVPTPAQVAKTPPSTTTASMVSMFLFPIMDVRLKCHDRRRGKNKKSNGASHPNNTYIDWDIHNQKPSIDQRQDQEW